MYSWFTFNLHEQLGVKNFRLWCYSDAKCAAITKHYAGTDRNH